MSSGNPLQLRVVILGQLEDRLSVKADLSVQMLEPGVLGLVHVEGPGWGRLRAEPAASRNGSSGPAARPSGGAAWTASRAAALGDRTRPTRG
jgi:hypothetical protein